MDWDETILWLWGPPIGFFVLALLLAWVLRAFAPRN